MAGENPYAPPAVAETESTHNSSGDGWKLLDHILFVHKGATLPKIDLETGISDPSLQLYRQPHALVFRPSNTFWSYADPRRTRHAKLRHILREVSFWPVYLLCIFSSSLDRFLSPFAMNFVQFKWMLILFAAHIVWGWLDRPKLKIEESPKPGWLRVTGIHPDALDYLRRIPAKRPDRSAE